MSSPGPSASPPNPDVATHAGGGTRVHGATPGTRFPLGAVTGGTGSGVGGVRRGEPRPLRPGVTIERRRPYDAWMTPITPCLWFDGAADAAVDHYLSIFPNSRRLGQSDFGPDAPGEAGSTMVVYFELDGTPFMALNGRPNFRLTPAVSFVINCESQDEIDYFWDRLLEGGEPMQCGWLTDRFGVSWQVVPSRLGELMGAGDVERANRVMQAVLRMVKFDIGELEVAAAG